MSEKWNQQVFEEFINLRNSLRTAKKMKSYEIVISLCEKIIVLDRRAKFIQIMVPIFLKETGNAYLKLNNINIAVKYFEQAKDGYIEYRNRSPLNRNDDWLKDIAYLEKIISKLNSKNDVI